MQINSSKRHTEIKQIKPKVADGPQHPLSSGFFNPHLLKVTELLSHPYFIILPRGFKSTNWWICYSYCRCLQFPTAQCSSSNSANIWYTEILI